MGSNDKRTVSGNKETGLTATISTRERGLKLEVYTEGGVDKFRLVSEATNGNSDNPTLAEGLL